MSLRAEAKEFLRKQVLGGAAKDPRTRSFFADLGAA